ncbi:DUF4893 domain-containing protein [Sulfitobacter albidus]|uniref:DUF4893 domain-containing protein n=1 Tax=Sulfitobacter albidus TaxID=2829501 RepID=UPI0020C8B210|nr:DUF4893 domain-containing protein [Sulfitobacter albidus]
MKSRLLAALCALLAGAAAAQEIRPQEQARLDRFERVAGTSLLQAMGGGAAGDVDALTAALAGTPQVAFDPGLDGDWRCRTMKLGGIAPLTVYSDFDCRITVLIDGLAFEKLTGSQRTKGKITLRDGRAVYLGVGYVSSESPCPTPICRRILRGPRRATRMWRCLNGSATPARG